jgi:hypothetical protein
LADTGVERIGVAADQVARDHGDVGGYVERGIDDA